MYTFLLILLILDALILIPVVLLQAGKGGGLAAMGGGAGTDTMFGTRHAATLLTKLSWWTGGLFVLLAFALSIMSSSPEAGGSILRRELQGTAPAVPAGGGAAAPSPLVPGAQTPAGQPGQAAPAGQPAGGTAPAQPTP